MSRYSDLEPDVHVSSFVWLGSAWRLPRYRRRHFITNCKDTFPITCYLLAIVDIQRTWRGILLRRRFLRKYGPQNNFVRRWVLEEEHLLKVYSDVPRAAESAFVQLARRVQARWRTIMVREEFEQRYKQENFSVYWAAAATIQRAWVDYQYHKNKKNHRHRSKRFFATRADAAASKIQLCWKGTVNRRIYRFYVSLIRFRESSDPAMLLKTVNAGEAAMMDKANGLHVRLRLGGTKFPPHILYKIYTHRPVADIGTFAPKDYAAGRRKAPRESSGIAMHSTVVKPGVGGGSSRHLAVASAGYAYQRVDNNVWRPVDRALLEDAEAVASAYDLGRTKHADIISKSSKFHYSRLQRQENKERAAKQTRRKWLAELYSDEQARRRPAADPQTIKNEATLVFRTMDDEDFDTEIEKLTEWTSHLDYEEYRRDWFATATSAPSDMSRAATGPVLSSTVGIELMKSKKTTKA